MVDLSGFDGSIIDLASANIVQAVGFDEEE